MVILDMRHVAFFTDNHVKLGAFGNNWCHFECKKITTAHFSNGNNLTPLENLT
jgi:hypothetical protein